MLETASAWDGDLILVGSQGRRGIKCLVGRGKTIKTPFGTVEYAVKSEGEPMLMAFGAGGG
jgi:hypothetical protein